MSEIMDMLRAILAKKQEEALSLLPAIPAEDLQQHGGFLLRVAAETDGLTEVLQKLIAAGVNVNEQGSCYGKTALHFALARGTTAAVAFLLDQGAELIPDNEGYTPLMLCCLHQDPEIAAANARLLLQKRSIDLDTARANGTNVLMFAACHMQPGVIDVLVECGVRPKAIDDEDNNALHYAFAYIDFSRLQGTVEALTRAGVPGVKNREGVKPRELLQMHIDDLLAVAAAMS